MVKVDISGVDGFINDLDLRKSDMVEIFGKLNRMPEIGWMSLPADYNSTLSRKLKDTAAKISNESEVFIVLGVGGSYLGARAMLDFIKSPFYNANSKETPDILFAGNNLSGDYLHEIIRLISDRNFSVNIISKSGSTIEPSIALRVFGSLLKSRYGESGLKDRLYITTDAPPSPLRASAVREGYTLFEMPEGVGGRYSVLTAVGLLPAAVSGIDIDELMSGACEEMETGRETASLYACVRQALYENGKKIELLSCFEPAFRYMGEWWKQLFGESEGKQNKGIFPSYADYSADLHSLGQYVQEGERTIMETFVTFENPRTKITIPDSPAHDDKLDLLFGLDMHTINQSASQAVKKAHIDGGVPVVELLLPVMSAAAFGALAYFFERSCALSALISGVNPFGQPGVEAYKKNLYTNLGLNR